jgi:transposase
VVPFFAGLAKTDSLIALEACASAHFWGRTLRDMGHRVVLLPPHRVKPFVAPGKKNDANDAAAIAEAANRPHIHPVPIKSEEQQALLILHSSRSLLVRQRTMLVNALRTHLAELGLIAPKGIENVARLVEAMKEAELPVMARQALDVVVGQIDSLDTQIDGLEKHIQEHSKSEALCRLVASIPGIGPITASLLIANVPDITLFADARHFAAWMGLVPRQNSSGGKSRLGGISKTGNADLRCNLVLGATSLLALARKKAPPPKLEWISVMLTRKSSARLVSVAVANKLARVVWAVLKTGEAFDPSHWNIALQQRAA